MEDSQLIDAALTQAFIKAPPYIQHYLWEGKFEVFMGELTKHFGLHADVAGKAENEILMTIIGMTPPNELAANLQNQAGVAPGLIQPILEELNREVFVPLRESLEKAPTVPAAAPQPPVAPPTPDTEKWIQVTPPTPVASTPVPPPPVAPAPVYTPPVVATPVTPPIIQPQPTPVPAQPVPPVAATPVPPPAPEYHEIMSMMRTMSKDIESLKGGVQPKMEPWKPMSVPVPPQPPMQPVQPVAATPVPPPTYISPTTPPATATPHSPTPIVHEHIVMPTRPGEDPYREPVE